MAGRRLREHASLEGFRSELISHYRAASRAGPARSAKRFYSTVPPTGFLSTGTSRATPDHKIIIAGGLDASNVAEAIRIAQPWGVDASSRLESAPGIKDHEKVRAFIKAAQEAK